MEFKSGDLVIFSIDPGLHFTSDGFTTVMVRGSSLFLPEKIDLMSYPSCNDFKGILTEVKDGDLILVLSFIGRPMQVTRDPKWFEYDVYSIYVNGTTCQAFKQNLRWVD